MYTKQEIPSFKTKTENQQLFIEIITNLKFEVD